MSKMEYIDDTLVLSTDQVSINHTESQYAVNMRKVADKNIYIKASASEAGLVNVMHVAMSADAETNVDLLLSQAGKASVNTKDASTGVIKTEVKPRLALVPKVRHILPNGMLIKFYGVPNDLGATELS